MFALLVSDVQEGKLLTLISLPSKCKFFAAFLIEILRKLWHSHLCADGQSATRCCTFEYLLSLIVVNLREGFATKMTELVY